MRDGGSLTEQASETKKVTWSCLTCAIGAANSMVLIVRGRCVSQRSHYYAVITNNLSDNTAFAPLTIHAGCSHHAGRNSHDLVPTTIFILGSGLKNALFLSP